MLYDELLQYVRFFFFQAEDGIRDYKVTGVQTCALPISRARNGELAAREADLLQWRAKGTRHAHGRGHRRDALRFLRSAAPHERYRHRQIGRASCRERV